MCFWNLNGERVPQIYTFGAQPNLRTEREEEVCLKRIRQKKKKWKLVKFDNHNC